MKGKYIHFISYCQFEASSEESKQQWQNARNKISISLRINFGPHKIMMPTFTFTSSYDKKIHSLEFFLKVTLNQIHHS